ncbi:hypothetical protein [Stenotrophomonas rhizophila]
MKYQERLEDTLIAISTSESSDMQVLGLSDAHLKDAAVEIARHMLALGARLAYGGDLRKDGFTQILFELVGRHRRDARDDNDHIGIVNYLPWPVHAPLSFQEIQKISIELSDTAELICLDRDGDCMSMERRSRLAVQSMDEHDWIVGLTSMRRKVVAASRARILLGGRVDGFKGKMPGIAEEAILSLQSKQPLFLVGGFGGCTRDIAEGLGLVSRKEGSSAWWSGQEAFHEFSQMDLNNGLNREDNSILAKTPHIDQAVILIMRGLLNIYSSKRGKATGF